tara:strand:+ start:284 stop:493 length:210 start_codon:yes stop_codon:yes gene_type:complete
MVNFSFGDSGTIVMSRNSADRKARKNPSSSLKTSYRRKAVKLDENTERRVKKIIAGKVQHLRVRRVIKN